MCVYICLYMCLCRLASCYAVGTLALPMLIQAIGLPILIGYMGLCVCGYFVCEFPLKCRNPLE